LAAESFKDGKDGRRQAWRRQTLASLGAANTSFMHADSPIRLDRMYRRFQGDLYRIYSLSEIIRLAYKSYIYKTRKMDK
jgi:hypothetical protein